MSDYDLKILTDHIRELAGQQRSISGSIGIATDAAGSLSQRLWTTHGVACSATNLAVSTAEDVRRTGGENLAKISKKLGENLDYAAANYENVDFEEGQDIGACSV